MVRVGYGRSRTTVKWHLRHIYAKCGVSRQAELMRLVNLLAENLAPQG